MEDVTLDDVRFFVEQNFIKLRCLILRLVSIALQPNLRITKQDITLNSFLFYFSFLNPVSTVNYVY